jgi:hypothetical protein
MKNILISAQWQLLFELCGLAGKFQLSLAEKLLYGAISLDEIDELCELISNEFMLNGIEADFEPNSYGRELEALMDVVNRRR